MPETVRQRTSTCKLLRLSRIPGWGMTRICWLCLLLLCLRLSCVPWCLRLGLGLMEALVGNACGPEVRARLHGQHDVACDSQNAIDLSGSPDSGLALVAVVGNAQKDHTIGVHLGLDAGGVKVACAYECRAQLGGHHEVVGLCHPWREPVRCDRAHPLVPLGNLHCLCAHLLRAFPHKEDVAVEAVHADVPAVGKAFGHEVLLDQSGNGVV